MLELADAPLLQLFQDHPWNTLLGCLVCFLLTAVLGCWWTAKVRKRGESVGFTVVLLVAISCGLSAYVAGVVSHSESDKQRRFAAAESQYFDLDSEREALYERAMELIGRVDATEQTASRDSTEPPGSGTQAILQTISDLSGELAEFQQEADEQHSRAKLIRAQYRELSIVVHTGKMLAELDTQANRLRLIKQRLQESL